MSRSTLSSRPKGSGSNDSAESGYLALVDFRRAGSRANCHVSISLPERTGIEKLKIEYLLVNTKTIHSVMNCQTQLLGETLLQEYDLHLVGAASSREYRSVGLKGSGFGGSGFKVHRVEENI